jgi:hypothetical protein
MIGHAFFAKAKAESRTSTIEERNNIVKSFVDAFVMRELVGQEQ